MAVQALAKQSGRSFEVIVVVDGSTDGTAEALHALQFPAPLRVIKQANAGASKARNRGAAAARGEVLLFLDDDMLAAPDLLAQHDEAYAAGADAVLGHIPVAPDSPRNFLSRGLGEWAERRRRRLIDSDGELNFTDLLTGQLSTRRDAFQAVGGFDERFTREGSFGGEDTDFGKRLFDEGYRVVFAPDAVSWQYYAVTPKAYLRQWHQAGSADVVYLRKHPREFDKVYASRRPNSRSNKFLIRPLARVPGISAIAALAARRVAVELAERRPEDRTAERIFFKVRNLEYWRGVQAAGGLPTRRPFRVLGYHSISDLRGAARLEQYGIPELQFRRQLRLLRRAGCHFISLTEALSATGGRSGLPRRAVLVTFDDCYTDLLSNGLPALQDEGVPAAAFAVAGRVGQTNSWDTVIGAPEIPLLDAAGLLRLERAGVEIGVHGSTHQPLTAVDDDGLTEETAGATAELTSLGLRPPRAFAYPHGENDERSRRAVANAGLEAAFTITPGMLRPGQVDPFALPRIEVLRRDGAGLRLLLKSWEAGRLPRFTGIRRPVRHLTRAMRRRLRNRTRRGS